jgi:hypothetical protein
LGKNIYKGSVTSVNNLAIIGSLFDQLSRRWSLPIINVHIHAI